MPVRLKIYIYNDHTDDTKNIMKYIKTFVIIHDEGDVVQKDKNILNINQNRIKNGYN